MSWIIFPRLGDYQIYQISHIAISMGSHGLKNPGFRPLIQLDTLNPTPLLKFYIPGISSTPKAKECVYDKHVFTFLQSHQYNSLKIYFLVLFNFSNKQLLSSFNLM